MSAKDTWNAFRACWIDVYLGPPAFVIHDPGTNFNSKEFRDSAAVVGTETMNMPVESHNSVGLVERYHIPLRRSYNILLSELPDLTKEERLQMVVKTVNNTAGLDGLVLTLLVFRAYLRISRDKGLVVSITARAAIIKKVIIEVQRCHAVRKVADVRTIRNRPRTSRLNALPLNSKVLV
jgi:hypothetical protein